MMAGQIFQIIAIILGFVVLYRSKNVIVKTIAYLVVFLNPLYQVTYTIIKFINISDGDESFVAYYLNISSRWITGPLAIFYVTVLIFMSYYLDGWRVRPQYFVVGVLTFSLGPILGAVNRIIL